MGRRKFDPFPADWLPALLSARSSGSPKTTKILSGESIPMKKFAFCILSLAMFTLTAFAAENRELPKNFLSGKHPIHVNQAGGRHGTRGNIPTPHGFPAGVDTLVNFTGHFQAKGIFWDGTSHNTWEYSMVGNKPAQGGTTTINAPVVPVTIDMRNSDGSPAFASNGTRLISKPDPFLQTFMNGPVFGLSNYSSSPTATQITDAVQRAEFNNVEAPNWHTLLAPSVKTGQTMVLTSDYAYALNSDGTCCLFVLVSDPVFTGKLFPPSTPDNSTVIGASEVAGDITTKDISTFMFPNTYLYENNDPNQCCVLGYHSFDFEAGDATNGNQLRFYVMNYSSWISPGLFRGGFEDITAHSHEVAELVNDPFVGFDGIHNITPFWFINGQCQDLMEVGDVIEGFSNATYPVTIGGYTYHPQNEALLPWFEFQKNSAAIDGAYSYPDETLLTALSAPQPFHCGF
jgi:hypothetical protein